MAFTDHKISAFTHKISDLADQPNLPPDELKARFDSSPEELRQAHNALCEDAARLDTRVSGIVTETFGDAIPKSMLSDELAAEIDAKATQASVTSQMEEESTARESGDADLQAQLDEHTTVLAEKAEVYIGSFSGGSNLVDVFLPFEPIAVIFIPNGIIRPCLLRQQHSARDGNGRAIAYLDGNRLNFPATETAPIGYTHLYIAFK